MTKKSPTIVFFGTDNFSLIALKGLVEAGYPIAVVVTKPDRPSGRGHKIIQSPIKQYSQEKNIRILQPFKISEIIDDIKNLPGIPVGVLSSYGKIIPQSIIDLFKPGIINIHPSLLPKYRGPSPVEASIIGCDETTGVSIMLLEAGMDSGPIYNQIEYSLDGTETAPELLDTLGKIGTKSLVNNLTKIISGELLPARQNDDKASYCQLINKADGVLNLNKLTAKEAEARIRAYIEFPKSRIKLKDNLVIITKAHITNKKNTILDLVCKDGKFLSIEKLMAPSGKVITAQEYINGYLK